MATTQQIMEQLRSGRGPQPAGLGGFQGIGGQPREDARARPAGQRPAPRSAPPRPSPLGLTPFQAEQTRFLPENRFKSREELLEAAVRLRQSQRSVLRDPATGQLIPPGQLEGRRAIAEGRAPSLQEAVSMIQAAQMARDARIRASKGEFTPEGMAALLSELQQFSGGGLAR